MSKTFGIMRSIIFILIFSAFLAFVPTIIYRGDFLISLVFGAGMFFLSVVITTILLFTIKRGRK
jgi:hypothetical protein